MKKTKRLISLFLSVFMFLSVTAGIEYSAFAETTGSQIAEYAKTFKGCSYKYAAKGPKCFDCSGFVYYVYKHFGFTVPTSTDGYSNASKYGTKITGDSNAKLGDIVVWSGHVGIYIGNGKVMNALGTKTGVCETEIATFVNSKRIKNPSHYYLRVNGVYETITNPSVTVKAPTGLKTNSVKLNFTVNNPSKITVKTVGIQVRKKGAGSWSTKTKAVASGNTNASALSIGCTVGSGKELNMSLSSGVTYEYRAYAVYNNKNYYSSAQTFTTAVKSENTKKLQTPTLKASVTSNGCFKLSWNSVAGATKYGIYVKQSNGTYRWVNTVIGTSWTTGTAQYGQQYSYAVLAATDNSSFAASDYSNVATVKNTKKLQAPTLKVAVNSNGSFKLSWNKVAGATKYGIYLKQEDGTYEWLKTVTGTSFTTGVAAKGKTYSYKIIAVTDKNKNATSNYSNVATAKR